MNTCYFLSALTSAALFLGLFQGIFHFRIVQANHLTFMIFVSILYFFTETLVIFFFVGIGVSIKEYSIAHNIGTKFQQQSLKIKREVYPPLLLNMLWMIILFILVGAVDTHRCPAFVYYALFIFCIWDYFRIKKIQHKCFRDNTRVVLDMSGIKNQL